MYSFLVGIKGVNLLWCCNCGGKHIRDINGGHYCTDWSKNFIYVECKGLSVLCGLFLCRSEYMDIGCDFVSSGKY